MSHRRRQDTTPSAWQIQNHDKRGRFARFGEGWSCYKAAQVENRLARRYAKQVTTAIVGPAFNRPPNQFQPGNTASKGFARASFDIQALIAAEAAKRPGLVTKLLDMAEAGDFRALEYTIDRLAGKPVQRTIEVSITAQFNELTDGIKMDLQALLLGGATDLQPTMPLEAPTAGVIEGEMADAPSSHRHPDVTVVTSPT